MSLGEALVSCRRLVSNRETDSNCQELLAPKVVARIGINTITKGHKCDTTVQYVIVR